MGLDSVEIVLCWEESLGIDVPDDKAALVATPAQSVDLLCELLQVESANGPSLTLRAFNRVRNILVDEFHVKRHCIRPSVRFSRLFPPKGRRKNWTRFQHLLGVGRLTTTLGWPLPGPGGTTVEHVVTELVARKSRALKPAREPWRKNQVREVVRSSVNYVMGIRRFSDNAHFVFDLGVD